MNLSAEGLHFCSKCLMLKKQRWAEHSWGGEKRDPGGEPLLIQALVGRGAVGGVCSYLDQDAVSSG